MQNHSSSVIASADIPQDHQSHEEFWQAVVDRNSNFDGKFFYAVRSTGIYCRPTCPSRRPHPQHVKFFTSGLAAEQAGFRPCRRCQPQQDQQTLQTKIIAICRYLENHHEQIPSLAELAQEFSLSPSYLQRVFKQVMGVSPFQYGNNLRSDRLKHQLQQGQEITTALYSVGYGSSSRLYEQSTKILGMTPATYRQFGKGEVIRYAIASSPLGLMLVAATAKGLCRLCLGDDRQELTTLLQQEFAQAELQNADIQLQDWIQSLIDYLSGKLPLPNLPCDLQATAFQSQVWQALRTIPLGTTVSYSDMAIAINNPKAVRAVASACGANPVALVIPCHRVVRQNGELGGYHWGIDRKKALLNLEATYLKNCVSL